MRRILSLAILLASWWSPPSFSSARVLAEDDDLDQPENEEDAEQWECLDQDARCAHWVSIGECDKNPNFMHNFCAKSCDVCGDDDEEEEEEEEEEDEIIDYSNGDRDDEQQEKKFLELRGSDLGVPQTIYFRDYRGFRTDDVMWMIAKARSYMKYWLQTDLGEGADKICRNLHEDCAYWALKGDCETNAEFMTFECAPVCGTCLNLTLEGRCPLDPNAPNVWGPGDLNRMFERLTSEPYFSTHNVQILSSPHDEDEGPWVITMDNIVTEEETYHLIEWGHRLGYRRSTDVGKRNPDGTYTKKVSEGRTSKNAWCLSECEDDPIVKSINDRISKLIEIPDENAERLQLLRYLPGQYYNSHHDMIEHQVEKQGGHRILTVFIYLNDVDEGGGTMFTDLDELTVMPTRGKVLIWPNVYDEDPFEKDWRTSHAALEVIKGVKYGANSWYHMRDFKTPSDNGCM